MSKSTSPLVQDPGRVGALAADIAGGRLSPVDLVERCLARIEAVEEKVEAWRVVDGDRALAEARVLEAEAKAGKLRGPLHGLPVGVKDIIDAEGLPTRCNSRSRANARPATADAEIVLALKQQGAIVLGKTHTTEFAFFDPSPARNPHNPAHTPGGSSSGSAAAVAAGMVPIALGTQTVASVNRPAAYCGIAAFKPSTRSTITHGIAPLAPAYDTVGFYGTTVDDAVRVYEAAASPFIARQAPFNGEKLRIVMPLDPHLDAATAEMKAAWLAMAKSLDTAGHTVTGRSGGISFERLFTIQRSTMLYDLSRNYAYTLELSEGQIGAKFLEAVRDGLKIPTERYLAERAEIDRLREAVLSAHADADCFLWPAAPGPAPEGLGWTGDPRFISPWTAIGGPMVTIPAGKTATGLPLGCILCSPPGTDRAMTRMARIAAQAVERHA